MHTHLNLVDHTKQLLLNKLDFSIIDTAQGQCQHTVNSALQYSEGLLTVVHHHIEVSIMKCYSAVSSTVMMVKGRSISLISGTLYHWQQCSWSELVPLLTEYGGKNMGG